MSLTYFQLKKLNLLKFIGMLAAILLLIIQLHSCKYSFRGINIPQSVNSFYVNQFDLDAVNSPPTLNQTFSERLKDKIRSESRLRYSDTDPDVEFSGSITSFDVSSVAPQPGETTAFSRLEITVFVDYINNNDEELGWQRRSFRYFSDFPSDQNLLSIQDQLIEDINEQLVEDIFNAAFSNW